MHLQTVAARAMLDLRLLTERRSVLILVTDAVLLFGGSIALLIDWTGAEGAWPLLVLGPMLLLGVPTLGECVELERRAGTLDLAMSSPGAALYFHRRVAALGVAMFVQSALVVLLVRFAVEPFAVTGPLLQALASCALVSGCTLYWALRVKGAGAPAFATYATVLVLAPWFFGNPIHPYSQGRGGMTLYQMAVVGARIAIIAAAAVLFVAYANRRLRAPGRVVT